jgi:hypothetical protein
MGTVLEEYTSEGQRSLLRVSWAKGISANDIHKEIFPVYGEKCFSRKALLNWAEKFSQGRRKQQVMRTVGVQRTERSKKK